MCARRFSPSKQRASRRPLPSIFITWAYSVGEWLVLEFWRMVLGLSREEEGGGRRWEGVKEGREWRGEKYLGLLL